MADTPSYSEHLKTWLLKHGIAEENASPGEMAMLTEDMQSNGKDYCVDCANEFTVRDMVLITPSMNPYLQMDPEMEFSEEEQARHEQDGYIPDPFRIRVCQRCYRKNHDL
jgi:hypothetical protein